MAPKQIQVQQLTEEQRQARLEELDKRLEELVKKLQDPQSEINSILESDHPKEQIYIHWAQTLEEKYVLLDKPEKIGYISNEIRITLKSLNLERRISHMYDCLESKYKTHDPNPNFEEVSDNPTENTSSMKEDESILLEALAVFKEYHKQFVLIAERYESHLTNPEMHSDFASTLSWKDIAEFCNALRELSGPMSLLQQMLDEGNIRQSATVFQKSMAIIFMADISYRQWAHKFGVSPRQNQRIRARLEEWPEKDAKAVIRNVIGSFCCPCGCSFNLVTKKHLDHEGKEFSEEIKKIISKLKLAVFKESKSVETAWLGTNQYPVPKEFQGKGMNPLEIAKAVFSGKLKPIQISS